MSTQSPKGPWPIPVAGSGGVPTVSLDVAITSVFLFLFILGAATHMTILQVNLRRGRKFIISGVLFGFCMARITASTLRLVWSTHQANIQIAIAASVFMSAGVLLLFVINLIFTQRIMRATHPHFAWTKPFSIAFKAFYASIVVLLVALITATVQSFYTLNPRTRRIDRTIQLVGQTYFAVAAFLPVPLLLINYLIPRRSPRENFGEGRFNTKIYLLLFTSVLLTFGAAFRVGISFTPRPRDHPGWWHSKALFYCINFLIEIIVIGLYAVMRVDKRFIIANGSKGPGDYSKPVVTAKKDVEAGNLTSSNTS